METIPQAQQLRNFFRRGNAGRIWAGSPTLRSCRNPAAGTSSQTDIDPSWMPPVDRDPRYPGCDSRHISDVTKLEAPSHSASGDRFSEKRSNDGLKTTLKVQDFSGTIAIGTLEAAGEKIKLSRQGFRTGFLSRKSEFNLTFEPRRHRLELRQRP